MDSKKTLYLLLAATLLLALLATPAGAGVDRQQYAQPDEPIGDDAVPPAPAATRRVEGDFHVDAEVSAELGAAGRADFFIWLRERADLSPAYDIAGEDQRRRFVFEALTRTADRSQAEIRAYLDGRGLEYEPLWINNSILVRGGDQGVVEAMRARDDVYRIRGVYSQMRIPDPEQLAIVVAGEGTQADTLWNINIVSAPQVWSQLGITGDGVVVANIDTGVRYTHEALRDSYRGNLGAGAYEHNYNWYPPTAEASAACAGAATAPCDWHSHGTHTMGTMTGGDGDGPFNHDVGMAPDAQWIACMGCDDPPNNCTDAALTICAQWVIAPTDLAGANPDPAQAPDVVNNSWGGGGEDNWYYSYVEAWNAANIIPVFSAGNDGYACGTLGSPGSYDNVIGVGGTDSLDRNYTLTSRGPGSGTGIFPRQKPDVAAPGEGVISSAAGSDSAYYALSGTSMAAPHVAGLAALMRQIDPTLSRAEIWDILTGTADTGLTIKNGTWCGAGPAFPNYVFGYGRINALAAVQETIARQLPPALSLAKSASAGVAEAGVPLTYTIRVENGGGFAANLAVTDTLPAGTLFARADHGGVLVGDQVQWSGLTLPGGRDLALSLAVTVTCVPSGTEILNSDYRARAVGMAAPVAGAPLPIVAQQHEILAAFDFPEPVVRNYPVTLANGSQYAATYRWDLGDGTTSRVANPTHTYTGLGAHTVVLTASNLCQTDVYSRELVVHDYALTLAPPAPAGSAEPGRTVTYTLRLTNTGTLADGFALSLDSHTWPTSLSAPSLGPLAAGAEGTFEVYVTVPPDALAGEGESVMVHATSAGDPRLPPAGDASLVSTTARAVFGLALAPPAAQATGLPGSVLTYTLHLTNTGNAADEFDLDWAGNAWDVQMPLTYVALDAGAAAEVPVRVTVPRGTVEGDQDIVVVGATSRANPALQASSTLTTVVPAVRYYYLPLFLRLYLPPG